MRQKEHDKLFLFLYDNKKTKSQTFYIAWLILSCTRNLKKAAMKVKNRIDLHLKLQKQIRSG